MTEEHAGRFNYGDFEEWLTKKKIGRPRKVLELEIDGYLLPEDVRVCNCGLCGALLLSQLDRRRRTDKTHDWPPLVFRKGPGGMPLCRRCGNDPRQFLLSREPNWRDAA